MSGHEFEPHPALEEHLALTRKDYHPPQATPYHETVDDLRRELASEAETFRKRAELHCVVFQRGEPEPTAPERDAYIGSLMAGNYAYTLAAVLKVAGEDFGPEVCERLACVADDILTNGDDHDRNADVMPAAATEATATR